MPPLISLKLPQRANAPEKRPRPPLDHTRRTNREGQAEHSAAHCRSGLERGGLQHSAHRPAGLPSLPHDRQLSAVRRCIHRIPDLHFRTASEQTHGPHQRLRGGAALLPQVFRCEVLHHDGSDDDRRHLAAVQQRGPGLVHLVFLHRTGRLPPAGGTAVRLQLRQGGPRRQGQGVISEIRPAWSSFGITVSKLLFFVGKIAS